MKVWDFCERIDIRKISLESSAVEKIGNSEFQQKAPNYYNFDVIISIVYRVKSLQDTQFRHWGDVEKVFDSIKKLEQKYYTLIII